MGERSSMFINRELAEALGMTPRQLIYLAERDIVTPFWEEARGRGSKRVYGKPDVTLLIIVKALREVGLEFRAVEKILARQREVMIHAVAQEDHVKLVVSRDDAGVAELTLDSRQIKERRDEVLRLLP